MMLFGLLLSNNANSANAACEAVKLPLLLACTAVSSVCVGHCTELDE
jgi:hypothetical protein